MYLKLLLSLQLLQIVLAKNFQAAELPKVSIDDCVEETEERLASRPANLKVCVADCLGLTKFSAGSVQKQECLYNIKTGNIADSNTKKIKPFTPANNDFKVYCFYRAEQAGPTLTSLAASKLCTNIMVEGFVEVSKKPNSNIYTCTLKVGVVEGVANEIKSVAANYKDVRLHLSFGELSEDSCRLYSAIVSNEESRKSFEDNIIDFLVLYNFTGLHLNWKYPVCWVQNCKAGPKSDRKNYGLLVSELAARFQPMGFMLSCASPILAEVISEGFDVNAVTDNVDLVILCTKVYHGVWESIVEHQAVVRDIKTTLSMARVVVKPVNMKKFITEISYYWDVHRLADKSKTRTGSKSLGRSKKFPEYTSYYILCNVIKEQNWTVSRGVTENLGFYAYKDDNWVSYDDVASIRFKSKFFRQDGMTGVSVHAVNADDFSGRCGCGKFPLLRAVSEELRGQRQELPDCT